MDERLEKSASRLRSARHYYEQAIHDVEEAERRKAEGEKQLEQFQPGWEMPVGAGLILGGVLTGTGAGAYAGRNLGQWQDIPMLGGALLGTGAGALGALGVSKGLDKLHPERPTLRDEISREMHLAQLATGDRDRMGRMMVERYGDPDDELKRAFRRMHNWRKEQKALARHQ